jgi:glycerol-3-phosphate acyltransferase PlsY
VAWAAEQPYDRGRLALYQGDLAAAERAFVRSLGGSEAAAVAAAVGAVAGYGWPLFMQFNGGKALGTATGAATAISPGGFFVLLASYALGALLKQTSLGTLVGFVAYAAYVFYSIGSAPERVASLLLLAVIVARRLEGVSGELERERSVRVVLNLLLFQRRPQRPCFEGEKRDG